MSDEQIIELKAGLAAWAGFEPAISVLAGPHVIVTPQDQSL